MSTSSGGEVDDNELVESGELHTRCASPRRLAQELASLLEGAQFMVEVRLPPPIYCPDGSWAKDVIMC